MAGTTTKGLSELEGAVLGAIWRDGPVTAYAVRAEFERSPTSFFSGSAGAIYPLVRRLERRGLIRSRARRADGRATRMLEITETGRRALRAWIGPPVETWMASVTLDPIRTRVLFSGILSSGRRATLLEEAERALEAEVTQLGARCAKERADAPPEIWLATDGALAVARARLRWVRSARRHL